MSCTCVTRGEQIIHVRQEAAGAYHDGTSWENAYHDLQDALDEARTLAEEEAVEVWVTAGVYHADRGTGDQGLSFELANNVGIYGGFAGVESSRDQRDWLANVTTLSGDLLGDDDASIGWESPCCSALTADSCDNEACIEAVEPVSDLAYFGLAARFLCGDICRRSYCDNTARIVVGLGVDRSAILDGFTISGGEAFRWVEEEYEPSGAGLYLHNSAATIRNCVFTNNRGEFFPVIEIGGQEGNCLFENCTILGGRSLAYSDSSNNYSCYANAGDVTFVGCHFRDNQGAVKVSAARSASFYSCEFRDNTGTIGGALFLGSPTIISDCIFERNESWRGGAMDVRDWVRLVNCVIRNNRSNRDGGAISTSMAELRAENCIISGNRSRLSPAGISVPEYTPASLINCVVAGNLTEEEAVVAIWQGDTLHMKNTIVFGNRSLVDPTLDYMVLSYDNPDRLHMAHCIVEGWDPENGGVAIGTEDPMFVDPGHWDDAGTPDDYDDDVWVDGDYHLLPGSPAINAGDPSINWHPWATDLDGHPQVLCGEADIGAYEFGIGDADCDQAVTLYDSAFWQYCLTGPPQDDDPWDDEPILSNACKALDFNTDNHVDLSDFASYAQIVRE